MGKTVGAVPYSMPRYMYLVVNSKEAENGDATLVLSLANRLLDNPKRTANDNKSSAQGNTPFYKIHYLHHTIKRPLLQWLKKFMQIYFFLP